MSIFLIPLLVVRRENKKYDSEGQRYCRMVNPVQGLNKQDFPPFLSVFFCRFFFPFTSLLPPFSRACELSTVLSYVIFYVQWKKKKGLGLV